MTDRKGRNGVAVEELLRYHAGVLIQLRDRAAESD